MDVEIVEFYPYIQSGNKYKGTLHAFVKLGEVVMDIRGIYVYRKNDTWFFKMPFGKAYDHQEKKDVLYPFFCFTNPENQKELLNTVIAKGKKYISDHWKEFVFKKDKTKKTYPVRKMHSSYISQPEIKKKDDLKINMPYKYRVYTSLPTRRVV